MVVRMRHTRAHTANRRSHHALAGVRLSASKEGGTHPRHRALLDGSPYRGRSVIDLSAKRRIRAEKAAKKRGTESGSGPEDRKTEEKA